MNLETQAELIVISCLLLCVLTLNMLPPGIELQDTFDTTISDKYIEDSNIPFSENQFYVFEFPLEYFKKEYVNESVYNNYEIGDNYTHMVVYEEW